MNKGIVIEITEQSILIMTSDGQFKHIAKQERSCQIGEEISYVETYRKPLKNWRSSRSFGIAAASVFCLVIIAVLSILGVGNSSAKVAAYVTMDINPSIEVGIEKNEQVVEARGINEDGIELIKDLAYEGLTLEAFWEIIVERIEQGHYLDSGDANIIITSTVVNKEQKDYEIELAEKVKLKFIDAISHRETKAKQQIVVTAITAPPEVRNEAIAQGVSTGKKAMQLLTRDNKKSTSDDELKGKPIQEMIVENGGMDNILPKDRKVTKEELKSMLDKQLEDKKERKLNKDQNRDEHDRDNDDEDEQKEQKKNEQEKIKEEANIKLEILKEARKKEDEREKEERMKDEEQKKEERMKDEEQKKEERMKDEEQKKEERMKDEEQKKEERMKDAERKKDERMKNAERKKEERMKDEERKKEERMEKEEREKDEQLSGMERIKEFWKVETFN